MTGLFSCFGATACVVVAGSYYTRHADVFDFSRPFLNLDQPWQFWIFFAAAALNLWSAIRETGR